jgi:hypothetical protein
MSRRASRQPVRGAVPRGGGRRCRADVAGRRGRKPGQRRVCRRRRRQAGRHDRATQPGRMRICRVTVGAPPGACHHPSRQAVRGVVPRSGVSGWQAGPRRRSGATRAEGVSSHAVAVGTAVTRRPPHRSVRAELPHTALAVGSGFEALRGIRVEAMWHRQELPREPVHARPWHPVALTATAQLT